MWVYDLKTLAFLAVNDAAIVHYGYSREEFLGMTLKDIRPMEDIPALLAVVAKLSAGTNRSGQWRHRKKDGSLIEVEITSHGLYFAGRPAELVLVSDITERKRAEEALRFTQFAVDHAGDAVFWIDAEARFVYVNEAACRSLGYSRQELLSLTVHDVDPDYPRDAWPAHWAETKRRGCMVFESRHRAKDGRVFPVEINANCLEYAGKEYNCSFARNITDRKRLEQQLTQSQKMEAIGRLAGGVAHDFNNLLAVISGYTESLLRHVGQDSALRNSVAEIERAAERGASLTRQLLAFSRRQVIEPRVLDLNEVVKGLGEMLERTMGRKIRMRIECGEGLGKIHSDAGQMEQVVVNLALNARDSMSDGGELRIETGNVKVADGEARELGLPGGEYVRLSVCDTGRGMDDEVRSRVFEPFITTKECGGTGLGLSIVYGIVQQAGGTVAVRSRVGEGSRFDVLLPRAEESETEKGRAGGGGEVKGRASG
jgi:PAS domain S-box-containing protein